MSKEEVKQKIIITAIECIESEGLQNVTVRKIAERAGVNVAAVNYHFGFKEQLLKIALRASLQESFVNNVNDYSDLWQTDTKKALKLFLTETLRGAIAYPNLTKAHIQEAFDKNNYDSFSVASLNDFLGQLYTLIRSDLRQQDELKGRIAVCQMFSAILLAGMMPDLFTEFSKFDMKKSQIQEKFIETLLENFIS